MPHHRIFIIRLPVRASAVMFSLLHQPSVIIFIHVCSAEVFLCGAHTLNLYPYPQLVSIYCGFEGSVSIFSRIFLICTVTVAFSP